MTPKRFAPLAALLLTALLLAGCGGGGGGEPTVTQTIHDELQAELDAALAAKRQAETARAAAETAKAEAETARATADEMRTAAETARATAESERDTAKAAETAARAAQAEAEAARAEAEADEADARAAQLAAEARLATAQTDLTAAEDKRDEYLEGRTEARTALTTANAEVTRLTGELSKAQAEVTRLTGELTTANGKVTELTGERNTANAEVTRLTGLLTAANADVARLSGVIGDATDAADAAATASLNAQLKAAKAKVTELTARVGSDTDASSLSGMLATANAEVTRLTGLLGTAQAEVTRLTNRIGSAGDATSLLGMLDAEKVKVRTLEGEKRLLDSEIASLKSQLATARDERDTAQEQATQAQRDAERQVTEAREQAQEQAERQANVALRAEKLIPVLVLTSEDADREDDVTVNYTRKDGREFEPIDIYPVSGAAPSISGWHSSSFTRDRSDTTDTIYLYTNIDAPSTRAFWKDYGPSVAMTEDLQAMATGSSAGNNGDTEAGTDGRQYTELTVSGTFRGASGKFTCDSCGGTIGQSDGIDSHVTFERGKPPNFIAATSWTFEPTRITNGVRLDQDDTYLYFGIWLQEPKNAADTPDFKWIAGGGDETGSALGNFDSLTGTATFTGGAVGKYAVKTGVNRDASVGTFTAKAELRAQFGTTNTISGGITEFREGGQSLAGWNIYLEGPTNGRAGLDAAGTTGSPTAAGRIGGVPVTGSWAALLFGNDNITANVATADLTCQRSGCAADLAGVAGWFQANDNVTAADASVAIAGAFGAEYKP